MEEAEVRAEVEKRKRRAKELGLVGIVFRLYRDHIRYLDEGFDHERSCMPKSLTRVAKAHVQRRFDSMEATELFFGESSLVFVLKNTSMPMPDGEIRNWGNVEIAVAGETVFNLRCKIKRDEFGSEWEANVVDGFIEGPWVETVKKFAQQVFSLRGQQSSRIEKVREQEELHQMGKRFGI